MATRTIGSTLRQSFIAGLLVLLPVFVTVRVLYFVFEILDGALGKTLNRVLHVWIPGFEGYIPGIGLLATLLVVVGVGWFTRFVYVKQLLGAVDGLLSRIPFAKSIYNASKQFLELLRGSANLPFRHVVMIEYPMPGIWTMGLLARDQVDDGQAGAADMVVVFVPSNHLHLGYPVVMPREKVRPIQMKPEDAIKFFVSCGVLLHDPIRFDGVLGPPAPVAEPVSAPPVQA